ncbi:hypothetical protein CKO28_23380 [Rhodovibrio sodomensis]|uniref:Sulfotransferase domain-containing protein n=1 Tax=Rhodovibrio sodomensis TaxID=1088 RepID=A0ABS1DLY7_9PROT|nr:sulfotransferase [Rhodovibrio sodomensis]MBK1670957.1 hypothetical protein [Rhodovibrio sodomensis]
MTRLPVIHVGYHKTATTWFQKTFYPIVQNGVYIPRQNVRRAFLCPSAFTFDADEAHNTLDIPEGARPIICEEALVGYYGNAGLLQALSKDVAFRLRDTFPDAQIVITLRHQFDAITATYLQYIRRGGTASVRRFLWPYHYQRRYRTKPFKKPMFRLEHLEYHRLIRHYRAVFGAGNVHIYLYEDFRDDPRAFLARMCRDLGLEADIDALELGATNISYGTRTAQAARMLNVVTVGDAANAITALPLMPRKVNEVIMQQLNRTPLAGPKVTPDRLLGPALRDELAAAYADSNAALQAELGLDLARHGYPLPADGTAPGTARDAA